MVIRVYFVTTYHVHRLTRVYLLGNFPDFQMPKAVGSFSLDIHRHYKNDFSELRYLALPEESPDGHGIYDVQFDLTNGIKEVIEKDEESIRQKMLDDLLTWILQERKEENWSIVVPEKPLKPLQIEFVCFRGLITMLITTPVIKLNIILVIIINENIN